MKRRCIAKSTSTPFSRPSELLNPALSRPARIVGGLAHERGVAATCKYMARRYGIHAGMPLRQCHKLARTD